MMSTGFGCISMVFRMFHLEGDAVERSPVFRNHRHTCVAVIHQK